jgi:hypothetical protein
MMFHALANLAATKPTAVMGLSAQDVNILLVFVRPDHD